MSAVIRAVQWPPIATAVRGLTATKAMGHFLETWRWHHFATLTSQRWMAAYALRARFEREMVRELIGVAQQRIAYFFAIEYAGGPDVAPHLHVLLAGTERLPVDRVSAAWRYGMTRVRVYDAAKGAALYSTKDLLLDPDGYDFSSKPPQRRTDPDALAILAMLERLPLTDR